MTGALMIEIILSTTLVLLFASNFFLWVEVKAMKNSTHQITQIRATPGEFEELTAKQRDELTKELFDNLT